MPNRATRSRGCWGWDGTNNKNVHPRARVDDSQHPGQTMTEYALILASIAVVVFGTYRALGNNISSLAKGVDSTLTNA